MLLMAPQHFTQTFTPARVRVVVNTLILHRAQRGLEPSFLQCRQ